jgi:glutamate-5-semialdehyde dehydrogenase
MTESFVVQSARGARQASLTLAALSIEARNGALEAMAQAVEARREEILAANAQDRAAAQKLVDAGHITQAAAKRLDLSGAKLDGVIEGLRSVAALPDPLGCVQRATELDAGLNLYRVSCPIGVIAMIFESRPDALPQIASLCLKSGNAVLLKGGSEALGTNRVLARVLDEAARSVGVPAGWMTLLETREEIAEILGLDEWIDLIVPRGSNEFVRYIMDHTKIPVTGHRDGICHTYIHAARTGKRPCGSRWTPSASTRRCATRPRRCCSTASRWGGWAARYSRPCSNAGSSCGCVRKRGPRWRRAVLRSSGVGKRSRRIGRPNIWT